MIELYYRKFCPYSRQVLKFIEQRGLAGSVQTYEIGRDREAMVRLKALIGGQQVPCLVVDGKPLLESDAIIAWLAQNAPRPAAGDGFGWFGVTSPALAH